MENLRGRTAVITGAATGMGRSMALTFAREGINVAIADIDLQAAEATRDEVLALGVNAIAVQTDVSKLEAVESLAEEAYASFGNVDILVNNAGVTMRPFRASWDTAYADFQWMMNVNWWGVLHGHHVFVPRMRQQPGDKHIVNTSSMASLRPIAGHSAYSASKMAVDGFSLVVREEYKTAGLDIGVSILYPGAVTTRINTSERLRPEQERSEVRGVKPWSSYLPDELQSTDPRQTGGTQNTVLRPPIDPDEVGPMVLEGIKHDKLYIATHPVPQEHIDERRELLANAYWSPSSSGSRTE
ncbi:SDR family NAD(P)-dependent oxidoreductase [Pseudarthrobacter sp. fls2-241-R2A-168]|uniref:SDR family NAD(P)-dependent oxidoreductase n=1 Tax=Pseudarthrobacter sp. fls2-241-R2A-168 TaxID=3040304 RepID=UPI002556EBEC|nr:SDR family NAD(P)-dependent oxidoreductase [Pseudarthrobacter sp. fls2-241-R2A-168]